MPTGLNKLLAIGRLGRDPELRYTAAGLAMVTLSVAVDDAWKDKKTGEKRESCEWLRCVLMGPQAEYCAERARKGSLVYIEGKLQTRKWQDKQGQDRYTTEIMVRQFQLLEGKFKAPGQQMVDRPAPQAVQMPEEYAGQRHYGHDEVPF